VPDRRLLLVALPLIAAPLGGLVWTSTAEAASCRVMTVRYDLSRDGLVVLDPNHYDIAFGGCVQFVNQTAAPATITVGTHYHQRIGPSENTAGATNYKGTTSGRQTVTARSDPAGTARGSITVAAAPTPSRTAEPSKPSHSAQTSPPPSPTSSSGSTGPQVAPTPSGTKHPHPRGGGLQPPVPPAGPIQTPPPSPTPAPAATAVVAGPVEPASGRGTGLPAALAALAVVGSGAAFLRVLAAEPVDSREIVGGQP
jgi:hypothetical protein